jgi:hypothetical protein
MLTGSGGFGDEALKGRVGSGEEPHGQERPTGPE